MTEKLNRYHMYPDGSQLSKDGPWCLYYQAREVQSKCDMLEQQLKIANKLLVEIKTSGVDFDTRKKLVDYCGISNENIQKSEELDDNRLVNLLCDISYNNGWILTYKLDRK